MIRRMVPVASLTAVCFLPGLSGASLEALGERARDLLIMGRGGEAAHP
jgi:hypothetical protein